MYKRQLRIGALRAVLGRPQTQETRRSSGPPQDEMGRFVSAVLAQNEDVWTKLLPQQGNTRYQPPQLVLFSGCLLYTSRCV